MNVAGRPKVFIFLRPLDGSKYFTLVCGASCYKISLFYQKSTDSFMKQKKGISKLLFNQAIEKSLIGMLPHLEIMIKMKRQIIQ